MVPRLARPPQPFPCRNFCLRWGQAASDGERPDEGLGWSDLALMASLAVKVFCRALTGADFPRCDPLVDFGATKPPAAADAKAGESELMNQPVHGGAVSSCKPTF
jgi:hypothetical protein